MQIKGLYVSSSIYEPPCLLAVSHDEEKLKNILLSIEKDINYNYIIREVELFIVSKTYTPMI